MERKLNVPIKDENLDDSEQPVSSIDASDVSFTPDDANWKVTNVQEAIDSLNENN